MLPKHFTCLTVVCTTLLLVLCCHPPCSEGSRILAVFAFPGKSHYMMHSALIKELVDRGHEVTMVAAFSLKHLKLGQNYTEILIEPVYDFWSDVIPLLNADNIFELTSISAWQLYKMMEIIGLTTTEHALKQPKIQQLINDPRPRGQYDLLLCEQFYQEPFLALAHIYDIPVVTSGTLGFENHMSQMMGLIMPWSFVPHGFTPYTDHMTFMERVVNSYYSLGNDILREIVYFPKMDKMVKQYFGHLDVIPLLNADNIFELTSISAWQLYKMMEIIGLTTTEHALKQPKIQQLINDPRPRGQYDLLLCEQFYQEPFLALAHIYDIPVVTSGTLGFENHMSQMMGLIMPWSFVPHGFTPYTDHMTFMERVVNSYYSLGNDILREIVYFPKMDKMVKQYFGHLDVVIPPITKMEKNISMTLVNSHPPLTTTRPLLPGMISVGGMHIYPPKKLPEDIQKFLDAADEGAIFFSLGSNVQSKDMPHDKLRIFLDVFGSLKQRVIWKFENESIKNLPKNVLIKAWLPQSDILAHPNTKVFITHGGLFGTQEGVHHGVPMLGIPIYCDQHLNMRKAEISGYAITLHFQSITREILKESLQKLLYDPYYRDNVKRYSTIFRDRPMSARDTAAYWIEYVIRHKGAPHMRSAGLDLKWYQFYLLDVIAFVGGVALLALAVVVFLIRKLCRRGGKAKKAKAKKN